MATTITPTITALQAQAEANLFLSNHLPDRFMAAPPSLDLAAQVWRVPVLLAYPIIGPVGQTGESLVSMTAAEVVSSTPIEAMNVAARTLYAQHRNAIEAPRSISKRRAILAFLPACAWSWAVAVWTSQNVHCALAVIAHRMAPTP